MRLSNALPVMALITGTKLQLIIGGPKYMLKSTMVSYCDSLNIVVIVRACVCVFCGIFLRGGGGVGFQLFHDSV